jgi:hypothetical protein
MSATVTPGRDTLPTDHVLAYLDRRRSCSSRDFRCRGWQNGSLRFAVPVAELGLGLEHRLIALRLRPQADLPAVRIVDDGER